MPVIYRNSRRRLPQDDGTSLTDDIVQGTKSSLFDFLKWLDRPGQAVRNVLGGNYAGAGRQAADFGLEIVDAPLPTDVIPELSQRSDYLTTSELLRSSGIDVGDGAGAFATDLIGDTLTNPLSYVTGGAGAARGIGQSLAKVGARADASAIARGGLGLARDDIARAGVMRQALPDILESSVKKSAWTTPTRTRAVLDEAYQALNGGGVDEVLNVVRRNTDVFDEGGVRFAGIPIMGGERLGTAVDTIVNPIGRAFPALKKAGHAIRSTTGNLSLDASARTVMDQHRAFGEAASRAFSEDIPRLVGDLDDAHGRAIVDAYQGAFRDEAGNVVRVPGDTLEERLATVGAERGLDIDKLRGARERIEESMQDILEREVSEGVMSPQRRWFDQDGREVGRAELDELAARSGEDVDTQDFANWMDRQGFEERTVARGAEDYLPRIFRGVETDDFGEPSELSSASSFRGRKLKSPDDVASFLEANPDATLERDLSKVLQNRAEQHGRGISRARLVREYVDPQGVLNDPKTQKVVGEFIDTIRKQDPDFAQAIKTGVQGLAPRGWFTDILAKANAPFKKAAVFGIGIPRFAGISRNRLGGVWQALSAGDMALAAQNARRLPQDLALSVTESLGLKVSPDRLGQAFTAIDDAFKAGGSPQQVFQRLREIDPVIADAMRLGVVDNLVSSDHILRDMSWVERSLGGGKSKTMKSILDWPSRMFQGVEQRMRLGTFMDLVDKGYPPNRAAQIVKDSYLDYSILSESNRTLRDIIPFAAFQMKTIPQQVKAFAQRPYKGVLAGGFFGENESDNIYPWMQDQATIGIGEDREGNPLYLSGLGLPTEALSMIPSVENFGEDIRTNVAASASPILKTAYGAVTGRDPFFDTPAFTYDKAPAALQALGADERGPAGRLYRTVAGTGLIQPIDSALRIADKWTDERVGLGTRAIDALSGINTVSVDPLKAREMRLESIMQSDPTRFRQAIRFYAGDEDEQTQELLDRLRSTRSIRAEQRKRAATGTYP